MNSSTFVYLYVYAKVIYFNIYSFEWQNMFVFMCAMCEEMIQALLCYNFLDITKVFDRFHSEKDVDMPKVFHQRMARSFCFSFYFRSKKAFAIYIVNFIVAFHCFAPFICGFDDICLLFFVFLNALRLFCICIL